MLLVAGAPHWVTNAAWSAASCACSAAIWLVWACSAVIWLASVMTRPWVLPIAFRTSVIWLVWLAPLACNAATRPWVLPIAFRTSTLFTTRAAPNRVMLFVAHSVSEPAPMDAHVWLGAEYLTQYGSGDIPERLGPSSTETLRYAEMATALSCAAAIEAPRPMAVLRTAAAVLHPPPAVIELLPLAIELVPPAAIANSPLGLLYVPPAASELRPLATFPLPPTATDHILLALHMAPPIATA